MVKLRGLFNIMMVAMLISQILCMDSEEENDLSKEENDNGEAGPNLISNTKWPFRSFEDDIIFFCKLFPIYYYVPDSNDYAIVPYEDRTLVKYMYSAITMVTTTVLAKYQDRTLANFSYSAITMVTTVLAKYQDRTLAVNYTNYDAAAGFWIMTMMRIWIMTMMRKMILRMTAQFLLANIQVDPADGEDKRD